MWHTINRKGISFNLILFETCCDMLRYCSEKRRVILFVDIPLYNIVSVNNLNLFCLGQLRSKLSQLILITLDRSFQMESISFLNEVWKDREAISILICWVLSKEASGTIFITSLVWRERGLNHRPPAYGANALTTDPPLRLFKWLVRLDFHVSLILFGTVTSWFVLKYMCCFF